MNKPTISVIIPVYKVENFLDRCVQSVANQTYKNLEIILVDDGSPDRCPQMCDDFALRDKRIKVIHKQNGGLSDARNVGTSNATGEYIFYLDSDDYIESNTLETLYQNLIKANADVSFSDFEYVFDNNEGKHIFENKIEILTGHDTVLKFTEKNAVNFAVAWCKLIKRELLNNITFPVGRLHEDEFTTYKILFQAKTIVHSNNTFYRYYQRSDSIVNTKKDKNYLDVFDAKIERFHFYKQNAPILFEEFAKKEIPSIVSANAIISGRKSIDKQTKKNCLSKTKQLLKDNKNIKINFIKKLKIWFKFTFPKTTYFAYKLAHKDC